MIDDYISKGKRKEMVEVLLSKGIQNKDVLQVIEKLPRHFFLDELFKYIAYDDKALNIGSKQTMSQPYTVARILELLEIKPKEKILDIGTGSGYQACLIGLLGAEVHSVEIIKKLFMEYSKKIKYISQTYQIIVNLYLQDGRYGIPEKAPFDKIAIAARTEEIPSFLVEQMREEAILVAPLGNFEKQILTKMRKEKGKLVVVAQEKYFTFVPLTKQDN